MMDEDPQIRKASYTEEAKNTCKESMLILVYEFMGSALLTLLFISTAMNKQAFINSAATGPPPSVTPLLMGLFVLIMFSARISGSHYNPIITFSFMIGDVKQNGFNRLLGLLYVGAQVLGALTGGVFCTMLFAGHDNLVKLSIPGESMGSGMLGEALGAFIMVFMYLCSTEEKTKFTKDSVIQTMILAASYLAAMKMSGANVESYALSPVNPAVALGMLLTFYPGQAEGWKSIWIFLIFGFIGSFLAFLFFRFVYKTTRDLAEDEAQAELEEENDEDGILEEDP